MDLQAAIAEFSNILDVVPAQMLSLTDTDVRVGGGWCRKEILGHLIDSAANNHQRFVRGQHDSELATPGYAQEQWVETERFNDREWSDLVQLWLAYNRHLLHIMSHVAPERLDTIVRIGANDPVTLEFVMTDYVAHMKHHLEQMGVDGAIE